MSRAKKATPVKLRVTSAVDELIESQRQRRFAIVSQSRCDRAIDSYVARMLGYDVNASPADRKAVFKKAAGIRKQVEKGRLADLPAEVRRCIPMIKASAASRGIWDEVRDETETRMRELAAMLPAVYDYVESVRGFGALGLGIVIGETGNLLNYPHVAQVWKRLGLAVIYGERQQKRSDLEQAALHGYSPKRRAEVWALFSDSMFRLQWAADKDADGKDPKKTGKPVAVPAHAIGPYGEIYAKRRAFFADRANSPGHGHKDACRFMTKAVICDLWRVWHGLLPRYDLIPDSRKEAA